MTNARRAAALAAIGQMPAPLGHFVNGRSLSGAGEGFAVTEPATGEIIGTVCDATEAELNSAVAAAKAAFPQWAATPGDKRKAILHKVADIIEARSFTVNGSTPTARAASSLSRTACSWAPKRLWRSQLLTTSARVTKASSTSA